MGPTVVRQLDDAPAVVEVRPEKAGELKGEQKEEGNDGVSDEADGKVEAGLGDRHGGLRQPLQPSSARCSGAAATGTSLASTFHANARYRLFHHVAMTSFVHVVSCNWH